MSSQLAMGSLFERGTIELPHVVGGDSQSFDSNSAVLASAADTNLLYHDQNSYDHGVVICMGYLPYSVVLTF